MSEIVCNAAIIRFLSPGELAGGESELTPAETGVLDKINQKVAAGSTLDEVMNFLFETTRELFPCDRISLAFLEDQDRRLVSRWLRTDYETVYLKNSYSEGRAGSSLDEVLRSGKLRIINNLEEYLKCKPDSNSSRLLVREGVRSSMTCPLRVDNRTVGVMFRSCRKPNAYNERQALLHSKMAERLSQAVEKAYRIDQLSAANKAYLEMLSFASHELKSPLASIVMDGDLLLRGYHGELPPAQREQIGKMVEKAKALIGITREYLDLSRYESGKLKAEIQKGVDLRKTAIDPILGVLEPQIQARRVDLGVELIPPVQLIDCDPELLKIVFMNLLDNAVKYGREGGAVKLRSSLAAGKLEISVWNEGTGFPKEEYGRLFKRFSRLKIPEFQGIRGTGVGLYLVWQIVQLHGGKIYARSEFGKWAEFIFTLPQAA